MLFCHVTTMCLLKRISRRFEEWECFNFQDFLTANPWILKHHNLSKRLKILLQLHSITSQTISIHMLQYARKKYITTVQLLDFHKRQYTSMFGTPKWYTILPRKHLENPPVLYCSFRLKVWRRLWFGNTLLVFCVANNNRVAPRV